LAIEILLFALLWVHSSEIPQETAYAAPKSLLLSSNCDPEEIRKKDGGALLPKTWFHLPFSQPRQAPSQ
jgi:hypothetical protein